MAITSGFNKDLLAGVSRLHFIGIGGSGMFPLVQILASKGYTITGSDVNEGTIIDSERAMGIQVYMGHAAENVLGADMVVYSAAIHEDNPELQEADMRGIPCVERSVMLGYVSRLYPRSICVAGTHGKTTTTSLITTMLELAGRDPAAVIGGKLPLIHGYGKAGSGQNIVVEACEFAETFLRLADAAAHAPHQIQLREPVEDAADGNFAQREKLHRRFRREHLMVVEIGKYLPVVIVFHL